MRNITSRDFTYLANISYNPNCSQKDLAVLLFVSESNVVKYNFNYNENAQDKEIIYKLLAGDVDMELMEKLAERRIKIEATGDGLALEEETLKTPVTL